MSNEYIIHFVKDNKYMGGWAFNSFTSLRTIIPLYEKHPELFEGEMYKDHDGYTAFAIKISEEVFSSLESLKYEYIGEVEYDFFEVLRKGMERAIERNYKLFLAI